MQHATDSATLTELIKLVTSLIVLLTVVVSFKKKSDAPQIKTEARQKVAAQIFRGIVFIAIVSGLLASWLCDSRSLVIVEVWSWAAVAVSVGFLILPFYPSKSDIWIFIMVWVMDGFAWLSAFSASIDSILRALSKSA